MQVGSVNQVNFKAMALPPVVNAPQVRVERMPEAEGKSAISNILNDKYSSWSETYNPQNNSVSISSRVATDVGTYNISNDGTAVHSGGFTIGGPVTTILVEKNPDLAEYVQVKKKEFEIKNKLQNEVGTAPMLNPYAYSQVMTAPVYFGNNVQDNTDVKPSKVEDYKSRLEDAEWEKRYVPEGNFIHMKKQNVFDGLEYEITPDGKVTEVGCWSKPTVILEGDEESKKLFGKTELKTKSPDAEEVKTDALKTDVPVNKTEKKTTTAKEKVANIWKFFSTADKMVGAVIKGTIYGALTGTALVGGAWMFRALPKAFTKGGPKFVEVFKHPLKHIGKAGKIIAGLGTATVFGYHVVAGKLDANQRTAVIDHKLKTGHRDV